MTIVASVLILSDTHLRQAELLPTDVFAAAQRADFVVHAGDHSALEVHTVLGQFAPVIAVCGNVEEHAVFDYLPQRAFTTIAGVRIGVVHNAGQAAGRHDRLARELPECRVRVYGHSHMPEIRELADGSWVVNPGSPTQRRRAPEHTFAWLEIGASHEVTVDLVTVTG